MMGETQRSNIHLECAYVSHGSSSALLETATLGKMDSRYEKIWLFSWDIDIKSDDSYQSMVLGLWERSSLLYP